MNANVVVVIDDDEDDVFVLTELLQAYCPDVHLWHTDSVEQLADWVEQQGVRPMLVITSLRLPTTDGLAILEWAMHCKPCERVPIVVWSGWYAPGERRRCYELGARNVLLKERTYQRQRRQVQRLCHQWLQAHGS